MPRAARTLVRQGSTALLRRNGGLLDALRSELHHEQSQMSKPVQSHRDRKVGNFTVDWDDPNTQDLVLRRRFTSGEEIAVSAIFVPLVYEGDYLLPCHVSMKVCVKKPEPEPLLQFDCKASRLDDQVDPELVIERVKYLGSMSLLNSSRYKGPSFSCLDTELQEAFKEYLVKRGIDVEVTNFLLLYLQQKEQGQYVTWLRKLDKFFNKDV